MSRTKSSILPTSSPCMLRTCLPISLLARNAVSAVTLPLGRTSAPKAKELITAQQATRPIALCQLARMTMPPLRKRRETVRRGSGHRAATHAAEQQTDHKQHDKD